jgi:uncharacterized protein YbjT (DUF2867 family)
VDAGRSVRVLTRERTRAQGLPDAVEIAIGDLRETPSILAAVRGCDAVVSAAHGFVGPDSPSPEAIDRIGNRTLIGASAEAGVSHFVLVSVHGASRNHPMSLFRAKHAAEEHLRASGLPFTIVRATAFMETWLNIMSGMLEAKGRVTVFGPGTNPVNFVSASDVAAAVALTAIAASPANETLEISGPDNIGLAAFARQIIQARGKDTPIEHVPLAALRALSVLARPFAPSFARQAQCAVLMNTTDMTVSREAASNARRPGIPTTSFVEVLARAGA